MAGFKSFEDIEAWKESCRVCEKIYKITRSESFSKDWALRDQMRRAAISVPSNIAEGFERDSKGEFLHFLSIAKGSAGELRTQLYIAKKMDYIEDKPFKEMLNGPKRISSKIANLRKHLIGKKPKNY